MLGGGADPARLAVGNRLDGLLEKLDGGVLTLETGIAGTLGRDVDCELTGVLKLRLFGAELFCLGKLERFEPRLAGAPNPLDLGTGLTGRIGGAESPPNGFLMDGLCWRLLWWGLAHGWNQNLLWVRLEPVSVRRPVVPVVFGR